MENALVIFDLIVIGLLWKAAEQRDINVFLFGAAFYLVFSIFTKGFTGLFPLSFFGIYWLVFRRTTILNVLLQTGTLVIFTVGLNELAFLVATCCIR